MREEVCIIHYYDQQQLHDRDFVIILQFEVFLTCALVKLSYLLANTENAFVKY